MQTHDSLGRREATIFKFVNTAKCLNNVMKQHKYVKFKPYSPVIVFFGTVMMVTPNHL